MSTDNQVLLDQLRQNSGVVSEWGPLLKAGKTGIMDKRNLLDTDEKRILLESSKELLEHRNGKDISTMDFMSRLEDISATTNYTMAQNTEQLGNIHIVTVQFRANPVATMPPLNEDGFNTISPMILLALKMETPNFTSTQSLNIVSVEVYFFNEGSDIISRNAPGTILDLTLRELELRPALGEQHTSEIKNILQSGELELFQRHLQGLRDVFDVPAPRHLRMECATLLSRLQTQLRDSNGAFDNITDVILKSPFGYAEQIMGGLPPRIVYYCSPLNLSGGTISDIVKNSSGSFAYMRVHRFECETGEQPRPVYSLIFRAAPNSGHSSHSSNNGVFLLDSSEQFLQQAAYKDIVYSNKGDNSMNLIQSIAGQNSSGRNGNSFLITLPGNRHCARHEYRINPAQHGHLAGRECQEIGFKSSEDLALIITALRRQAVLIQLLETCIRTPKQPPKSATTSSDNKNAKADNNDTDATWFKFDLTCPNRDRIQLLFEHPAPGFSGIFILATINLSNESDVIVELVNEEDAKATTTSPATGKEQDRESHVDEISIITTIPSKETATQLLRQCNSIPIMMRGLLSLMLVQSGASRKRPTNPDSSGGGDSADTGSSASSSDDTSNSSSSDENNPHQHLSSPSHGGKRQRRSSNSDIADAGKQGKSTHITMPPTSNQTGGCPNSPPSHNDSFASSVDIYELEPQSPDNCCGAIFFDTDATSKYFVHSSPSPPDKGKHSGNRTKSNPSAAAFSTKPAAALKMPPYKGPLCAAWREITPVGCNKDQNPNDVKGDTDNANEGSPTQKAVHVTWRPPANAMQRGCPSQNPSQSAPSTVTFTVRPDRADPMAAANAIFNPPPTGDSAKARTEATARDKSEKSQNSTAGTSTTEEEDDNLLNLFKEITTYEELKIPAPPKPPQPPQPQVQQHPQTQGQNAAMGPMQGAGGMMMPIMLPAGNPMDQQRPLLSPVMQNQPSPFSSSILPPGTPGHVMHPLHPQFHGGHQGSPTILGPNGQPQFPGGPQPSGMVMRPMMVRHGSPGGPQAVPGQRGGSPYSGFHSPPVQHPGGIPRFRAAVMQGQLPPGAMQQMPMSPPNTSGPAALMQMQEMMNASVLIPAQAMGGGRQKTASSEPGMASQQQGMGTAGSPGANMRSPGKIMHDQQQLQHQQQQALQAQDNSPSKPPNVRGGHSASTEQLQQQQNTQQKQQRKQGSDDKNEADRSSGADEAGKRAEANKYRHSSTSETLCELDTIAQLSKSIAEQAGGPLGSAGILSAGPNGPHGGPQSKPFELHTPTAGDKTGGGIGAGAGIGGSQQAFFPNLPPNNQQAAVHHHQQQQLQQQLQNRSATATPSTPMQLSSSGPSPATLTTAPDGQQQQQQQQQQHQGFSGVPVGHMERKSSIDSAIDNVVMKVGGGSAGDGGVKENVRSNSTSGLTTTTVSTPNSQGPTGGGGSNPSSTPGNMQNIFSVNEGNTGQTLQQQGHVIQFDGQGGPGQGPQMTMAQKQQQQQQQQQFQQQHPHGMLPHQSKSLEYDILPHAANRGSGSARTVDEFDFEKSDPTEAGLTKGGDKQVAPGNQQQQCQSTSPQHQQPQRSFSVSAGDNLLSASQQQQQQQLNLRLSHQQQLLSPTASSPGAGLNQQMPRFPQPQQQQQVINQAALSAGATFPPGGQIAMNMQQQQQQSLQFGGLNPPSGGPRGGPTLPLTGRGSRGGRRGRGSRGGATGDRGGTTGRQSRGGAGGGTRRVGRKKALAVPPASLQHGAQNPMSGSLVAGLSPHQQRQPPQPQQSPFFKHEQQQQAGAASTTSPIVQLKTMTAASGGVLGPGGASVSAPQSASSIFPSATMGGQAVGTGGISSASVGGLQFTFPSLQNQPSQQQQQIFPGQPQFDPNFQVPGAAINQLQQQQRQIQQQQQLQQAEQLQENEKQRIMRQHSQQQPDSSSEPADLLSPTFSSPNRAREEMAYREKQLQELQLKHQQMLQQQQQQQSGKLTKDGTGGEGTSQVQAVFLAETPLSANKKPQNATDPVHSKNLINAASGLKSSDDVSKIMTATTSSSTVNISQSSSSLLGRGGTGESDDLNRQQRKNQDSTTFQQAGNKKKVLQAQRSVTMTDDECGGGSGGGPAGLEASDESDDNDQAKPSSLLMKAQKPLQRPEMGKVQGPTNQESNADSRVKELLKQQQMRAQQQQQVDNNGASSTKSSASSLSVASGGNLFENLQVSTTGGVVPASSSSSSVETAWRVSPVVSDSSITPTSTPGDASAHGMAEPGKVGGVVSKQASSGFGKRKSISDVVDRLRLAEPGLQPTPAAVCGNPSLPHGNRMAGNFAEKPAVSTPGDIAGVHQLVSQFVSSTQDRGGLSGSGTSAPANCPLLLKELESRQNQMFTSVHVSASGSDLNTNIASSRQKHHHPHYSASLATSAITVVDAAATSQKKQQQASVASVTSSQQEHPIKVVIKLSSKGSRSKGGSATSSRHFKASLATSSVSTSSSKKSTSPFTSGYVASSTVQPPPPPGNTSQQHGGRAGGHHISGSSKKARKVTSHDSMGPLSKKSKLSAELDNGDAPRSLPMVGKMEIAGQGLTTTATINPSGLGLSLKQQQQQQPQPKFKSHSQQGPAPVPGTISGPNLLEKKKATSSTPVPTTQQAITSLATSTAAQLLKLHAHTVASKSASGHGTDGNLLSVAVTSRLTGGISLTPPPTSSSPALKTSSVSATNSPKHSGSAITKPYAGVITGLDATGVASNAAVDNAGIMPFQVLKNFRIPKIEDKSSSSGTGSAGSTPSHEAPKPGPTPPSVTTSANLSDRPAQPHSAAVKTADAGSKVDGGTTSGVTKSGYNVPPTAQKPAPNPPAVKGILKHYPGEVRTPVVSVADQAAAAAQRSAIRSRGLLPNPAASVTNTNRGGSTSSGGGSGSPQRQPSNAKPQQMPRWRGPQGDGQAGKQHYAAAALNLQQQQLLAAAEKQGIILPGMIPQPRPQQSTQVTASSYKQHLQMQEMLQQHQQRLQEQLQKQQQQQQAQLKPKQGGIVERTTAGGSPDDASELEIDDEDTSGNAPNSGPTTTASMPKDSSTTKPKGTSANEEKPASGGGGLEPSSGLDPASKFVGTTVAASLGITHESRDSPARIDDGLMDEALGFS